MSEIVILVCEICGKKQEKSANVYWTNNFNGGEITVCRDGLNQDASLKWGNLCIICREIIVDAVKKAIEMKKGEKL